MNDQTPDDHETTPSLDAITERRLRNHLTTSAEHVTLPDLEPSLVRHTARQRTIRHHRAVVGGVAAATVMGMIVGVQALSGGGGGGLRISDSGATSADNAPVTAPATAFEAPPAQLGEPAFVWKVVESEQSQSIVATFNGGGTQSFPGLAVSTSPGRSNDYDNITPSVWRTTDGVSWEQTDLGLPFGDNRLWESIGSEGRLFAIGTAPGIAATDPNPLQVAIAGIDSSDWIVSELPFDTNAVRDRPFVVNGLERQVAPVDGGVMVAVTPSAGLNAVELADASDAFELEQLMEIGADGISVRANGCAVDEYAPSSTVVMSANGGPVATASAPTSTTTLDAAPESVATVSTEPDRTAADSSECPLIELTWDDLSVPAESVAALRGSTTTFYLVGADGAVTPVESPSPGAQFASSGNGTSADFVVTDSFGNWASDGSMYRFANGAWQTLPMTFNNWATAPLRLGEATVGFGYPTTDDPTGPVFTTIDAEGTASFVDTDSLFDEYSMVSASGAAVAANRWVSTMSTTRDELAAAGGAEFTQDGLTVRQESMEHAPVFIDAATEAEIPESDLRYGDNDTITARNAAGEVIGTVTWDDIYSRLSAPYETPERAPADWSILTTADGATFARESVAELLGVEPSAISYVPRVYSDGTQVVVVVTLNERYPDDSHKQVALVGTPIG